MHLKKKNTSLDILLVSENKQQCFFHFTVKDNSVEFLARFIDTTAIIRINNEDQPLGA